MIGLAEGQWDNWTRLSISNSSYIGPSVHYNVITAEVPPAMSYLHLVWPHTLKESGAAWLN